MEASLLTGWENFYVIVGSSAGGLTGITFVVIALIRDVQRVRPTGLRAFLTPIIVHIAGLSGLIYGGVIAANMSRQGSVYVPVHEDWIWNVALPAVVYGALLVMGFLIWRRPLQALYGVGAASLVLLFIGIRNAWDLAVWMTVHQQREPH